MVAGVDIDAMANITTFKQFKPPQSSKELEPRGRLFKQFNLVKQKYL